MIERERSDWKRVEWMIIYVQIGQDLIGHDRIEEWTEGWSDRERKEIGKTQLTSLYATKPFFALTNYFNKDVDDQEL